LVFPFLLTAQDYTLDLLGRQEGLLQGMVSQTIRDKNGFVWVATISGLYRYDGYTFQSFLHKPGNVYTPSSNNITGIFEDSAGRIWVGQNGMIDCYDPQTGIFTRVDQGLVLAGNTKPDFVYFFETADGHIWVSCFDAMVEIQVPQGFLKTRRSQKTFSL
jgi:ligand-binding sensor domain-containing protein